MKNHYKPEYVEALFDDMSQTYSKMNYVTSFGFSERWRRQFLRGFVLPEAAVVVDLMAGMGECWEYIFKNSDKNSEIIALDFSAKMIKQAKQNKRKFPNRKIEILKEDVLNSSLNSEIADFVISGFGLKTFNTKQLNQLAQEIERILKVGGQFSLIDISVPKNKILRFFYLFYMKKIIPILGKLFLGNPETYSMLGIYTTAFGNAQEVAKIFRKYHFEVTYIEYFFGCASGIRGVKINP